MFNVVKKTFAYGDHQVTIETGEVARQAGGAVMVSMEETVVLVTVVGCQERQARSGFLPADRRLPGKGSTPPAVSPVASSSAKAVRPRRKP